MKNKYILLALLPLLSAGSIFGAQAVNLPIIDAINQAFAAMGNQNAQTIQNVNLKIALQDLIEFAKESDAQEATAIIQINAIKAALNTAKNAHYNGTLWSNTQWFFNIDPNTNVRDLKDNLEEVEDAFKAIQDHRWRKFNKDAGQMLGIFANRAMYVAGGAAIGAGLLYCYMNKADINKLDFWKSHVTFIAKTATNAGAKITHAATPIVENTVVAASQSATQAVAQASMLAGITTSSLKVAGEKSLDSFLMAPVRLTKAAAPVIEKTVVVASQAATQTRILAALWAHKIKIGAVSTAAFATGIDITSGGRVRQLTYNTYQIVKTRLGF